MSFPRHFAVSTLFGAAFICVGAGTRNWLLALALLLSLQGLFLIGDAIVRAIKEVKRDFV
jgi:4-hydroxybenzoate polyprenyltransferase